MCADRRVRRCPPRNTGTRAHCSSPRIVLALGMLLAPCAEATLAPDQADSYISSASGADQGKNFGKDPALKIGPTSSALIRFDLSTLPGSVIAGDVEKATLLLWVNKVDAAGTINVLPVTSAWSELGVTYNTPLTVGAPLPPLPPVTVPAVNQYLITRCRSPGRRPAPVPATDGPANIHWRFRGWPRHRAVGGRGAACRKGLPDRFS